MKKNSSGIKSLTVNFLILFIINQIICLLFFNIIMIALKGLVEYSDLSTDNQNLMIQIIMLLSILILQFLSTRLTLQNFLNGLEIEKSQIKRLLVNIGIFFLVLAVIAGIRENVVYFTVSIFTFMLMLVYINNSLINYVVSNYNFSYNKFDNFDKLSDKEKINLIINEDSDFKKFKIVKILILVLVLMSSCLTIVYFIYNKKKSNDIAEEILEEISASFEVQSEQITLVSLVNEKQVSFKGEKCNSVSSDSVECLNGETLKFYSEDYDYKINDILIKYNNDEKIYYIEANINGYKYYLNLEEKIQDEKQEKEEETEKNSAENKITISCTSYEKHNDYKLNIEFTVVYYKNIFVSYEQKNVEDYTSSSTSSWNNALNNYTENNDDIIIDEKNKTITTYIGTNRTGSNGNEDIFKKLNATEAINKLETSYDATCSKYSE